MVLSVFASTALKQSSKIKMEGFLINALAIATLCFCPPLKVVPRSPTKVSNCLQVSYQKESFL